MEQVRVATLDVALLCERLGWRGQEGFAQLRELPRQTVSHWLAIAALEREKEQKAKHG